MMYEQCNATGTVALLTNAACMHSSVGMHNPMEDVLGLFSIYFSLKCRMANPV
jgi:hypothetical protein